MRNIVRRAVVATVAAAALTAAVGPAFAQQGDYNTSGVRIRSWPSSSTIYGLGYPGQGSYAYSAVLCYNLPVNGDSYWDYNRDLATGVTGYSADALLTEYADSYPSSGGNC